MSKDKFAAENLEILYYMFKEAREKGFLCKTDSVFMKKFEELLTKCKDTILPVEYQKMVAQKFSSFLPLINGISKETIIDFLKSKHIDGFRSLGVDDLKILFEIYDAQIRNKEKGFFENKKEKNDDLIVGLLSSIKYEELLKLENPEVLYLYNQLSKETQKLDKNIPLLLLIEMSVDKQEEEMKAVSEYQDKIDEIIRAKERLDANDVGYSKTLTEM